MPAYITVVDSTGAVLHYNQVLPDLAAALALISSEYLDDPAHPGRYSGYFALRSGEITHIHIQSGTAGTFLKDGIAMIDVYSDRGLLEHCTFRCGPDRPS